MATSTNYTRSEIYSFFDLSEEQQTKVLDGETDKEQIENIQCDKYVILNENILPLSMFIRTNYGQYSNGKKTLFDGVYGTSYFSAYFIKLSRCGTMAVVAERFN